MSVTYGYDLKYGDKILDSPVQLAKMLTRLIQPGSALVNYLPFCAVFSFIPAFLVVPHSFFSAPHSFMGPIFQLRTTGANR
jgi:hypothetical protein